VGSFFTVDYTLDAMGNRTAENTYDPSNTNPGNGVTDLGYDANDNLVSVWLPQSVSVAESWCSRSWRPSADWYLSPECNQPYSLDTCCLVQTFNPYQLKP
jgi:YD repeat-containing protein